MVNRTSIVILGMPRSGCSQLARALAFLGVFFGEEDALVRPDRDDPGGALELKTLANLNARCLSTFGLHVTSVATMPSAWRNYPQATLLRTELARILSETFCKAERWAIKQPTIGLLMPLYQEVFKELGLSPRYVVCCRNPAALAKLPLKWNHEAGSRWTPALGPVAVGAWLAHTLGPLGSIDRGDVVSYDQVVESPVRILERLVSPEQGWSPTAEEWSAAGGTIGHDPYGEETESLAEYPSLVREAWAECQRIGRGEPAGETVQSLVASFETWRAMLAPPQSPGTQVGFAWVENGVVQAAQVPFLPTGDWQRVLMPISAPPNTVLSGLLYGRPCRVWIRRCSWTSKRGAAPDSPGPDSFGPDSLRPASLVPGPGSQCSESRGYVRLDGAYESQQVSLRTPSFAGPYELELEFLLEAGPQINVDTAMRLAGRLEACADRYAALSVEART